MSEFADVLVSAYAGVFLVLLAANALIVGLRLIHRDRAAAKISKQLRPVSLYLRLGALTSADRHRGSRKA